MMPKLDGYAVCRQLKSNPETRLVPVVLLTALAAEEARIQGIEVGADDFLTKPFSRAELKARIRALLKLKAFTDELEHAEVVFRALAQTIATRDAYTGGHCERLAHYAAALARRLGLPEPQVATTARGAFLHDLGKVGVPDAVLLKPGPLSPEERPTMERHPLLGAALLQPLKTFQETAAIILYHHEKYDGSGYPTGLAGDGHPAARPDRRHRGRLRCADHHPPLPGSLVSPRGGPPPPGRGRARVWRQRALVESFLDLVERDGFPEVRQAQ